MGFKVWGKIDGERFEHLFTSVAEWRAERRLIERFAAVVVMGMASVEVAA
ncbi:hypothetical protein [Agrobacterium vaccinii]|nr:hypothetical protein [Agrobacterium vaccinii]UHS56010.1 hypothetical protein HRS00_03875 [Agrobacterium vaccinii]